MKCIELSESSGGETTFALKDDYKMDQEGSPILNFPRSHAFGGEGFELMKSTGRETLTQVKSISTVSIIQMERLNYLATSGRRAEDIRSFWIKFNEKTPRDGTAIGGYGTWALDGTTVEDFSGVNLGWEI